MVLHGDMSIVSPSPPCNIFEIAGKLVKIQSHCKSVGNSAFHEILSVAVVSQIFEVSSSNRKRLDTPLTLHKAVSVLKQHLSIIKEYTSVVHICNVCLKSWNTSRGVSR